jgi:hypothetical protein
MIKNTELHPEWMPFSMPALSFQSMLRHSLTP